jgi:uncharacterized protein (TIGR03437 family)
MRWLVTVLSVCAISAQTLTTRNFGGSGSDTINGIALDAGGNIWVAGTTTSFDLPLLHPTQSANNGTSLAYSTDSGLTWKPLSNPDIGFSPYFASVPFAVDPTNASVLYIGTYGNVLKSTDGGKTFAPLSIGATAIVIDPTAPQTIYAGASGTGVFKSTDGGATWNPASTGLPAKVYIDTLTMDPFHPQSLWIWAGTAGWNSQNGGQSWSQVPIPQPQPADIIGGLGFVFDHATPGVVYGPSSIGGNAVGLEKSTDGGKTWTAVTTPPVFTGIVVTDPVRAGYLYTYVVQGSLFYRSHDGGATWQSFPFPEQGAGQSVRLIAVDPADPDILIAGSYRSTDDGQTWTPVNASRVLDTIFAPSAAGLAYAWAPVTSDVFLAEFAPDSQTLLFSTYFGGMGDDTATGIRIDPSGNIWVTGSTASVDLPLAGTPYQKQLKGSQNAFVAKFAPDGQLLASTYLGGSVQDSAAALRLDSGGNVWLTGQTYSPNFPVTIGTGGGVFLSELNGSLSQLLFSTYMSSDGAELAGSLDIDPNNNVVVTGTTSSPGFPLIGNVIHASVAPSYSHSLAFLTKFDQSGNRVFSTYLGGKSPVNGGQNSSTNGAAVATGSDGSIYLTGSTDTTDFPITPAAYQPAFRGSQCPYPTGFFNPGFGGYVLQYNESDAFVMKLSADGGSITYSTLLGGTCIDRPTAIAVTSSGDAVVAGSTNSIDFPSVIPVEGAPQIVQSKSFVSMLDPNGASLPFSTFLSAGSAPAIALGPSGVVHVGGAGAHGYLASIALPATAPDIDLQAVLNDFSLIPGPIAAGEIVRLRAPGFVPQQSVDIGLNELKPLKTTLGGAQVLFDNQPVPLVAVRPGMIVCIAPESFGTQQSTAITIKSGGAVSNTLMAEVVSAAPGLLSADGSRTGLANARNDDGELNSPTHPAAPGSTLTLYLTGVGNPASAIVLLTSDGETAPLTPEPLKGFVPGIYAGYIQAVNTSQVSLFANYQPYMPFPTQSLTIYVGN